MEFFITTLIAVATMLVYAVPGYISVKAKLIKPESISAFAVVLMYVCSPCLTVYSVNAVPVYTKELIIQIVGFFFISMAAQAIMLGLAFLILRKKYDDVKYRVYTVATSFGNCAFMGVPLLQELFPGNPNVTILSVSYLLGMNIFGWTIGSAIITRDKKYIKPWKAIVNPAAIAMIICLPLFFTTWRLPEKVADIFTLLGKMSTPMCMLIMGMRLATVKPKSLFCTPSQYAIVFVKQMIFPFIGMLLIWFLPFEQYVKYSMFILCAAPVASVVLNFAEMLGEGQENAANLVLLGTVFSVATLPVMTLILQAIGGAA